MLYLAAAVVALYMLVAGVAYFAQDRLLLAPRHGDPASVERAAASQGLSPWRPGGGIARGWIGGPRDARATALLLPGNSGMALDRIWYARSLQELGLRVILLEYPGFGARGGVAPELAALLTDADQALHAARALAPDQPLVLIGESLGAGIAAQVVTRHADAIAALVLVTPWDSLGAVAALHYPWLPVRWLLKNPMDSIAALRGFAKPITVVLAERDGVIPPEHGERLAEATGARVERIAGAAHNDWMNRVDDGFWARALGPVVGNHVATATP